MLRKLLILLSIYLLSNAAFAQARYSFNRISGYEIRGAGSNPDRLWILNTNNAALHLCSSQSAKRPKELPRDILGRIPYCLQASHCLPRPIAAEGCPDKKIYKFFPQTSKFTIESADETTVLLFAYPNTNADKVYEPNPSALRPIFAHCTTYGPIGTATGNNERSVGVACTWTKLPELR